MQNKVELCGVNTAKLKVLKNEETRELLRRSKAGTSRHGGADPGQSTSGAVGDPQVFQPGRECDDLFQVGCIGLIKAIDNFNTDLDVRFSTYGVPMIVGEIRPLSPGQQHHPGVPGHAGHRL